MCGASAPNLGWAEVIPVLPGKGGGTGKGDAPVKVAGLAPADGAAGVNGLGALGAKGEGRGEGGLNGVGNGVVGLIG